MRSSHMHLEGLDVLRVLALACVFLFHLLPDVFKGGYLGVEMFFVLSGFLLAVKEPVHHLKQIPGFFAKKYLRLMPHVLIMVLIVCGLLGGLDPDAAYGLKEDAFHIFTGTFNFRLIQTSNDYFQSFTQGSAFTHLWTLAIELQWYFLWPFLSVFLEKIFQKDADTAVLICLLTAGVLFLIMPAYVLATGNLTTAYYASFTRSASFFLGILAGLQYCLGNPVGVMLKGLERKNHMLPYGSALVMLVLLMTADGSRPWMYCGGLAAVDLWCFLLVSRAAETRRIRSMRHWILSLIHI